MKPHTLLTIVLMGTTPLGAQSMADLQSPELQRAIQLRDSLELQLKKAKDEVDRLSKSKATDASQPQKSEALIEDLSKILTPNKSDVANASRTLSESPEAFIKIRQSVKDPSKDALPATFQYTRAKGADDTRAADFGITYERDFDFGKGPNMSWGILGEYHHMTKNSAVPTGVDTILLGGSLDWYPNFGPDVAGQDIRTTVAYKRDKIVSGEGVLTDLSWYPNFPELGIGDRRWGMNETQGLIEINLRPYLGVQYEKGDGAPGFREGERAAVRAGFSLPITLLPRYMGNRLTLDNKLSFWENFGSSGVFSDYEEQQISMNSKLTYWFFTPKKANSTEILSAEEQHIGLSFGYNWGDNPEEGKLDTEVFTFGLAIKY